MIQFLLILLSLFSFTLTAAAEDSIDRVKAGTTSIGVTLAGSTGNFYSPGIQYFVANNLFLEGGVRFHHASSTIQGPTADFKSEGVLFGIGTAIPLNRSVIGSLEGTYSFSRYDIQFGGTSQAGSVDANEFGVSVNIEFFLNSKSSLGIGGAYDSRTDTFKDTGISGSYYRTDFTTGWKFYFN